MSKNQTLHLSIDSVEELSLVSEEIIKKLNKSKVILFNGNLGAGKTSLIKYLAEKLGISKNKVKSPTYVLCQYYQIPESSFKFKEIAHYDLYRLKSTNFNELDSIGLIEDLQDENKLVLIEWPKTTEELLSDPFLEVNLEVISENSRTITIITKNG